MTVQGHIGLPKVKPSGQYSSLRNLTKTVGQYLFPPIKRKKMDVRTACVYGNRGSGKSELQNSLGKMGIDIYGEDKVNLLISDDYFTLVESIGTDGNGNKCNKPITILIVDDPLTYHQVYGGRDKNQQETLSKYFKGRHIVEERLNTDTGILIEIMGPQTIHGFERIFRNADVQFFKSTLGDEEEKILKEKLKNRNDAYNMLMQIEDRSLKRDIYKSFSIVRFGANHVGWAYFPMLKQRYGTWVETEVRSVQKVQIEDDAVVKKFARHYLTMFPDMTPNSNNFKKLVRATFPEIDYKDRVVLKRNQQLLFDTCTTIFLNELKNADDSPFFESEELLPDDDESFKEFAYRSCLKDMGNEYANIVRYTIEKRTQTWIAKQLYGDESTQGTISTKLHDINEKYIGFWFEKWYCRKHGVGTTAGRTNKPDFIDAMGNIKSLKCKTGRRFVDVYPDTDCVPEIKVAKDTDAFFTIVLCNILWGENSKFFIQESEPINPNKIPKSIRFFGTRKPIINYE